MADRSSVSVDIKVLKRLKAAVATASMMEIDGAPSSVTGWIAEVMTRECQALEARIEDARSRGALGAKSKPPGA
jgi:hypothetical protein